jgi:MFS family permease
MTDLSKPEEPKTRRQWAFTQKYRFDLGYQFLTFINFALLLIAASDKLKSFFHIENTSWFVVIGLIGGFFSVWLFGYVLDRHVRYEQGYSDEQVKRSPKWWTMYNAILEISKKLEREK